MTERKDVVERQPARPPAIAIVGNDVLLAARPASAVQLAHGLARLGFDVAVPASWGDELVASACLERCADRAGPVVLCSCPLVAERLLASGADLSRFLIPLVTPAVAVARYLRRVAGPVRPRVTYLGACPGATGDDIDERLTPDELFERLADAGLILGELPTVFESVIPPDRRRTLSLPGGAPTAEALRRAAPSRAFVELGAGELADELAQHLLSGETVLVDPAPRLGCACSGACNGVSGRAGRAAVTALEPPRSTTSAVDLSIPVELDSTLPSIAASAAPQPPTFAGLEEGLQPEHPTPPDLAPLVRPRTAGSARPPVPLPPGKPEPRSGGRLRSPALGVPRFQSGSPPVSRTGEGRALPRAYVAHRRTPPGSRRVSGGTTRAATEVVEPSDSPTPSPAGASPTRPSNELLAPTLAPLPAELMDPPPTRVEEAREGAGSTQAHAPAEHEQPRDTREPREEPASPGDVAEPAGTPGHMEPSLARLVRESAESARVVPRYEPAPPARRRTTMAVVATAALAVVVIAVAAERREPKRTVSSGIMAAPADSAGPGGESPALVAPADRVPDGASAATRATPERDAAPRASGVPSPTGTTRTTRPPAASITRGARGAPAAAAGAGAAGQAADAARTAPAAAVPAPAPAESTQRQAPPRAADSAVAPRADELADIRRELERRRARIDSLARLVDSMPARARPQASPPRP